MWVMRPGGIGRLEEASRWCCRLMAIQRMHRNRFHFRYHCRLSCRRMRELYGRTPMMVLQVKRQMKAVRPAMP